MSDPEQQHGVDRSTLGRALARALAICTILGGLAVGWFAAPEAAGQAFFEAAAQLIPVLLLALAVESRWLRVSLRPLRREGREVSFGLVLWPYLVFFLGLPILALCYAEWRCLEVLATSGGERGVEPRIVAAAIGCGLTGIALIALFGPGTDEQGVNQSSGL